METTTIDRLFLELSQVTTARTARETRLQTAATKVRDQLEAWKETAARKFDMDREPRDKNQAENYSALAELLTEAISD